MPGSPRPPRRWATRRRCRRSSGFPGCCAPKRSNPIWRIRACRPGAPISRPTTGVTSARPRCSRSPMNRLEAKGKGIVLLHDIQPRTVGALPAFLRELKARGYRVVHVVQATADRPKTPTEPGQWRLHPVSEMVASSRWPAVPSFVYADTQPLPVPAVSDSDLHQGQLMLSSAAEAAPAGARRGAAAASGPLAAAMVAAARRMRSARSRCRRAMSSRFRSRPMRASTRWCRCRGRPMPRPRPRRTDPALRQIIARRRRPAPAAVRAGRADLSGAQRHSGALSQLPP